MTTRLFYALSLVALAALTCHARTQAGSPAAPAGDPTTRQSASPTAPPVKKAADVYQFGRVRVAIPPPAGFEEAASQLETLKAVFQATEAPSNDLLAVHIAAADAARFRNGVVGMPDVYTKVSVLKSLREADTPAPEFSRLVSAVRSSFGEAMDPDGPTMKSTLKNIEEGLTNLTREQTRVDLSRPLNLGEVVSRPDVFGTMLLMNVKMQMGGRQVELPLLCVASFLRVRQRILFVYTYRKYRSPADRDALARFTREWLGQIAAANR